MSDRNRAAMQAMASSGMAVIRNGIRVVMDAVRIGKTIAAVKAPKDFRIEIDETCRIAVPAAACLSSIMQADSA